MIASKPGHILKALTSVLKIGVLIIWECFATAILTRLEWSIAPHTSCPLVQPPNEDVCLSYIKHIFWPAPTLRSWSYTLMPNQNWNHDSCSTNRRICDLTWIAFQNSKTEKFLVVAKIFRSLFFNHRITAVSKYKVSCPILNTADPVWVKTNPINMEASDWRYVIGPGCQSDQTTR